MLGEMSHLALSRADDEQAAALVQEHVELSRRLKDRAHTALALKNLGLVDRHRDDHAAARARFEESLSLRRELGERSEAAEMLAYLSSTACLENDRETARRRMAECLALLREVDNPHVTAACLELLAESMILCEAGHALSRSTAGRAARLLAAAENLRAPFNDALMWPAEREARTACLAAVRSTLGEEAFTAAWAEGSALSREQAIHEAARIEL
jgi:Tetratricopeptide repeat